MVAVSPDGREVQTAVGSDYANQRVERAEFPFLFAVHLRESSLI